MKNASITNDINKDFIEEMLPHHEGLIRMSQKLSHYNICSDLKPISKKIIKFQHEGIKKWHIYSFVFKYIYNVKKA